MATQDGPRLLWNPDNVRDVAESIGVSLSDEPLRILTQDVEFRIGQVIIEALRFMRAANRTTLTVQDVSQALRVLDVEPLYGYESTRPLRFGEASLGPGQPLFYIDDEEVDFEKLINAPLPKVPRDMSFTGIIASKIPPLCLTPAFSDLSPILFLQPIGSQSKVYSHPSLRIPRQPKPPPKTSYPKDPAPTPPWPLSRATTTYPSGPLLST